MLFNSVEFFLFLPIVFGLYWLIGSRQLRSQNVLIAIASYVFYGWWDWRFLSLILFSSLVDYGIGRALGKIEITSKRKVLLWISICVNLGFLGFFKYYNFFIDSLVNSFTFFGEKLSINTLNIILPVGISFYTFQTLSYTIYPLEHKILVLHPNTEKSIINLCKSTGIYFILLDSSNDPNWTFKHDSHWTCYGHERVANQVQEKLESSFLK